MARSDGLERTALLLLGILLGACGRPMPEPERPAPIPLRTGPLVIDVVYPPAGSLITARDSNFVFGSVGHGRARLLINGRHVPVEPNGAFLAWLPVPAGTGDTLARYEISASVDGRTAGTSHEVRLPPALTDWPPNGAALEGADLAPRGIWWAGEGESIEVRVRASPGASVRVVLPDSSAVQLREVPLEGEALDARWTFGRIPFADIRLPVRSGIYEGELVARTPLGFGGRSARPPVGDVDPEFLARACDPARAPTEPAEPTPAGSSAAAGPTGCAMIQVVAAGDTLESALPLQLWILTGPGPVAELREAPSAAGGDHLVVGRPAPGATYAWLWAEGVRVRVTGRRNEEARVALDGETEAWVAMDDLVWVAERMRAGAAGRARVGTVRLEPRPDRLEVRLAVSVPVPYAVDLDERRVTLTLYGAFSDTDWLRYGQDDPFLRRARWMQRSRDRYVLELDLARVPWGYRVRQTPGTLVLDLRKPPRIDPERPLAGRVIVIDPGHPPGGARGPTRLYEGDANLAIAFRVKRRLQAAGSTVYLTRGDRSAVRLYERTRRAGLLDADLLVSIHNNALPDGVNPFENHGTSVYYFHPFALDLAEALQRNLVRSLRLTDLGVGRANLALVRPTWMPAALTEGAFMMIPEHEALLRQPQFLEAHARGIVEGIREFLRASGG